MSELRLDPQRRYRLHDRVAVRPEPFGALVYHYGNRKLVFLKNQRIVDLVNGLVDYESVNDAFEANGINDGSAPNYLAALESLLRSDMLVEVAAQLEDAAQLLEVH
jgi:putative mycofactocin binding protein MftB